MLVQTTNFEFTRGFYVEMIDPSSDDYIQVEAKLFKVLSNSLNALILFETNTLQSFTNQATDCLSQLQNIPNVFFVGNLFFLKISIYFSFNESHKSPSLPQSTFQHIVHRILQSPIHLKFQPQPSEEFFSVDWAIIALVFPYLVFSVNLHENEMQGDAQIRRKAPNESIHNTYKLS